MKNIFSCLPIYTLWLLWFYLTLHIASVAPDDPFHSAELVSGVQYIDDFVDQHLTHICTMCVCCEEACGCVLVCFSACSHEWTHMCIRVWILIEKITDENFLSAVAMRTEVCGTMLEIVPSDSEILFSSTYLDIISCLSADPPISFGYFFSSVQYGGFQYIRRREMNEHGKRRSIPIQNPNTYLLSSKIRQKFVRFT